MTDLVRKKGDLSAFAILAQETISNKVICFMFHEQFKLQLNVKSRINRKTVFLRNSSVFGTILLIIIMRPVPWQNCTCVQRKTV